MSVRSVTYGFVVLSGWLTACAVSDVYFGADHQAARAPESGAADAERVPAADGGYTDAELAAPDAGADTGLVAQPTAGGPPSCTAGRADCDNDGQNGCETDLMTDPAHCGRCDRACQSPDCACRGGQLQTVCPTGRADCDGDARNGCEADTLTSNEHCGGCAKRCQASGHDAIAATCMSGRCHVTCQMELAPEGDCDGNPENGCETSLWTNENCGACGVRCVCNAGVCR
jgi:hypothetical protein